MLIITYRRVSTHTSVRTSEDPNRINIKSSTQRQCVYWVGERYGEIEYRGGKVLQRGRSSGGNVRLSHLRAAAQTRALIMRTRYQHLSTGAYGVQPSIMQI